MDGDEEVYAREATWRNEAYSEERRGKLFVFFYAKAIENQFKSNEAGRPIFEERIFLKKIIPGDTRLVIDRPMKQEDRREFPMEWARWEQKKSSLATGTPLELWPALVETQRAEFKALNIFTIDQFASLPDSAGEKIMGFHELRQKARAFIAAQKDSEMFGRIREEADAKIMAQNAQIEAQAKEMAELKIMLANLIQAQQANEKGKREKATA